MKHALPAVALLLAFTAPLSARTWKQASSGKTIEAELTKVEDGKVHLKLPDGSTGQVEVKTLSLEDREYLASLGKPTAAPALSAADRLRVATKEAPFVNSLGLEFVPVPGKEGVWMCRTETRVRDFRVYARVMDYVQTGGSHVSRVKRNDKGGYYTPWELDEKASWEKPGFSQSDDHPVTCVSWQEARAMCDWLTKQEKGLVYRLPTDAEWSAAVGSAGKYPWGNAWPAPERAGNYTGSEEVRDRPGNRWLTAYAYDDGSAKTARVGSYTENLFGFFDLGGNVSEMCEDIYQALMNDADALEASPGANKNEKHPDGTPFRVVRGGSWYAAAEIHLRSSSRNGNDPRTRNTNRGFRLVVVGTDD